MFKSLRLVRLIPIPESLHITVESISSITGVPQYPRQSLKRIIHIQPVTFPLIIGIEAVQRGKLRITGISHSGSGIEMIKVKGIFLKKRIEVRRQLLTVVFGANDKIIK